MRIVVFCPGPSLRQGLWDHIDPAAFDLSLGVNAAIERFACDGWVAADRPTYFMFTPKVKPKFYFYSDLNPLPELPPILEGVEFKSWRFVDGARDFSGIGALALAISYKPETIDVYGADMVGEMQPSGQFVSGRDNGRFVWERSLFSATTEHAERKGIKLIRHLPKGGPINGKDDA